MKVLFLQPPDPPSYRVFRDLAGRFGVALKTHEHLVLPPLDLAYAASVLEKNGHCVEIVDSPALDLNVKEVLKKFSNDEPDMTFVNTSIISIVEDLKIANLIKEILPDTWVCVAGSFVSTMPDVALHDSKVDMVVRNEVEGTILGLVRALMDKHPKKAKGIAYKKDNEIIKTEDPDRLTNLDELPFPAYHCLPVNQYYHPLLPEKPLMTMLTSRGCPFGCIYCPYPVGYGSLWRARSVRSVLAEIQFLVDKFHVRSILFRDQVFTLDMKRTEEMCRGIVERGIDISWRCETRVDRLSRKVMKLMKEAGCVGIYIGVESGDPKILSGIGKRGVAIDMIKRVFADAKELGVETGAFFLVGLPGETKKSVWKSFKLLMDINPDLVQLAAVTPYPGTELYRIAEEKGWILTRDWSKYTGFNVVMRTDDLSEEDIKRALEYWKKCEKYRRKKMGKESFNKKRLKKAFSNPLNAAKRALVTAEYYITNPQRKFEKWALEK